MHEVGLVEDAVKRAVAVMEAAGASSVERLTFAIALGGHVTPEAVKMLFEMFSSGTPVEGAVLEFETLQQEYGCWACGHTFSLAGEQKCPECGSEAVKSLEEPELVLRFVDVTEDVPDIRPGHRARVQPLHAELARAGRRRSGFTAR